MSHNTKIGIVTAAGYIEAEKYYGRLHGLLEAIKASTLLTPAQKKNVVIMGTCYASTYFPYHALLIGNSNLPNLILPYGLSTC